jgi:hypothetical protein
VADSAMAQRRPAFATVLGLAKPFVSKGGVRPKRVQRKILGRFRQIDFVDMDGFRAMSKQDLLGDGLNLRGPDTDPHHETVPFGEMLEAQVPLAQQAPPHTEYGDACCGNAAQHGYDTDQQRR